MGGVAGSGGSDRSDEKKVDTYADQLKKIQAKKSKYKINEFGYKVKKNPIERFADVNPVINIVTNFADKHNLNRRMNFANKNNISLQGLSTEQILSKDFKAKLDAKGYSKQPGNVGGNNDRGGGGNKNNNVTQMAAGVVTNTGTVPVPTNSEITQASATNMSSDEILLANKKKGRVENILTSAQGLGTNEGLITKKKTLGV